MPISKENRVRYPKDWRAIVAHIKERAGNCCELCGVENGAVGWWIDGAWQDAPDYAANKDGKTNFYVTTGRKRVVLTCMHLNHTPEDCRDENLKMGCQRCHNVYDKEHRMANAKRTREAKKRQFSLFQS